MHKPNPTRISLLLFLATLLFPYLGSAEIILGDPPRAPTDVSGLPRGGPHKLSVTGGFSVNTDSREQVRSFFNAVYPSSDGVPMNTTANVATCTPGTNSTAFQEAVLRRINWFRAMAGIPAAVTLNAAESANNQQGAVMMSANNMLSHFPPNNWTCFTGPGANAASNSNLSLGSDGSDAITSYIWDFGGNNYEVGHRRWVLYPQTQVMGTGDVPAAGSYAPANTTWVFDGNFGGPRPATRQPYVAWPPEGFVPYQVVFPQWSLGLSNANFSAATVTMTSNGVSLAVSLQPIANGFGENTLVWYPTGLDPTSQSTVFPFNGTDTVYSITVGNIGVGASHISISYNVTVFDPAVPGADYVPTTITGPSQIPAGTGTPYSCRPPNNTNVTSYQWRTSQRIPGNLVDNAQNGLTNFTLSPPPIYPPITNAPDGSGNCFHLVHPDATSTVPQLLQLNRLLFPASNAVVTFKSELGYASANEVARVQVSTDGGTSWKDLYTLAGTGGQVESSFSQHTLALSNIASQATLLRFNYDFPPAMSFSYFPGGDPIEGWCIENIVITNSEQLVNQTINSTPSTNYTFTPAQAGNFNLEAQGVLFTQFPIAFGPAKLITVVPLLLMNTPVISGGQVRLDFTIAPPTNANFKLLQANQLNSVWTTNAGATLTTNILGSSYRFTTTNGPAMRFYRILQL
ncbi:MAG TPA: CAP domain-containing protein [Candidatus Binatia bacterium]|jgi:hypothetical protein|nr:CAP domain-containing protein [Candidatus Binatia bacterium]